MQVVSIKGVVAGVGLALLMGLGGCSEEEVVNCIDWDGPTLDQRPLLPAYVGYFYSDTITASIDNEPNDDYFSYHFDLNGTLPPGIQLIGNPSQRAVILEGTPWQAGVYHFNLAVEVMDPSYPTVAGVTGYSDSSDLCFTRFDRDYTITVR